MTIQKVEIEVDVPEGWEVVRFGCANPGEWYFYRGLTVWQTQNVTVAPVFIVRKVKQYREPVLPADYGKQAEFSSNRIDWEANELTGWLRYHQEDLCSWSNQGDEWYPYCRIEVEAAS